METLIAVGIAVIIALIVCMILLNQMKSVSEKTDVRDYLDGQLALTQQNDVYTHTTKTRTKIERNNK